MLNSFGEWTNERWEVLFGWNPSLRTRILLSTLVVGCAFGLTWYLYSTTEIYFTSITMLSVVAISLFAGIKLAFLQAAILSMLNDYFFISPVGSIFTNRESIEHFLIVISATIFTTFLISSLKLALQRLSAAKLDAELATSQMEKVLALVSHDVRSPLGTAKMASKMISENADPKENQSFLNLILRNLDQADSLIQSLLDVSSIRRGKSIYLSYEHCDLSKIINSLVDEMSLVYHNRLQFSAQGSALGNWGVDGIRRAMQNLITNAIKYGGSEHPIVVSLNFENDRAIISVQNQGNEIAKKDQDLLFDYFQRGTSEKNNSIKGWGLGLALVKGVAEAHGGFVRVESGSGHGTNFILTLPSRNR